MEEDFDRLGKAFWEVELKNLNDGLPRVRRSLTELLKEEKPSYRNSREEEIALDRRELQELSKLVPPEKLPDVRLPFIIIKQAGSKKGEYQIQGSEADIATINLALKRPKENRFLFKPEVMELASMFPSLVVFGFCL